MYHWHYENCLNYLYIIWIMPMQQEWMFLLHNMALSFLSYLNELFTGKLTCKCLSSFASICTTGICLSTQNKENHSKYVYRLSNVLYTVIWSSKKNVNTYVKCVLIYICIKNQNINRFDVMHPPNKNHCLNSWLKVNEQKRCKKVKISCKTCLCLLFFNRNFERTSTWVTNDGTG